MEELEIKNLGPQLSGQQASTDNRALVMDLHSQQLNECIFRQESTDNRTSDTMDKGYMEYGCLHYRRRCQIGAPCCNEIFNCRHCHNGAKNNINVDQKLRHDMPHHHVSQVICSLCSTEQEVQQFCRNCGVCMGKYFCKTCKLFDDDTSKKQCHCNGCGICRIEGCENFFHCFKCGCCYSILLKNSHPCVEGAMHHDCPVCFGVFLFESRTNVTVMPCGHTIHQNCLKEMREHFHRSVICPKSGRSSTWKLRLYQCLNLTRIRWFGFFAMIVERLLRFSSML